MNAAPDRFASAEGDVVLFASTFIGEGHSGGVLLNDRGEIVAKVRGEAADRRGGERHADSPASERGSIRWSQAAAAAL